MHILAIELEPLDEPVELIGLVPEGYHNTFVIPAVTTDGRISFLPAGEDFPALQRAVSERMKKQAPKFTGAGQVVVVATVAGLETNPENPVFVFEVLTSPSPLPELVAIYGLLKGLRQVGDERWSKAQDYLGTDPRKSWINGVIDIWSQRLNWAEYVNRSLGIHSSD
jgi:hypothetical protein